MSAVKLKAPSGGSVLLTPTDSAADYTLTLPAENSTLLTEASGAAEAVYNPAGTGAVARSVASKLQESVSVLDFGAVGDGVTDDTAAIQAAIDSNASYIVFPPGVYIIAATLTLSVNCKFVGQSASIKWLTGVGFNMVEGTGLDFECVGLTFVGGTQAQADDTLTSRAIQITGPASRLVIKDCAFDYFDITGVYVQSSELLSTVIENILIADNVFRGNATQLQAITCFGGENVVIRGNEIDGCDSVAILCDDATSVTPLASYGRLRKFVIADNVIAMPNASNPSVNYGIQTCAVEALTITGNVISNNSAGSGWGIVASIYDLGQQAAAPGGGAAYLPLSEDNSRVVVANNSIYNVAQGVRVEGYEAPVIANNNVTCTSIGIYVDNEAATVDGVAYDFPTGGFGDANVSSNVIISKNAAAVGIRMDTQRNYSLDNAFVGTFAKRYENSGVPALTTQNINDADRSPLYATVYDRNVANLTVSGTLAQGTYCIRKLIDVAITDNVAATIATITTADESGSADGGAWVAFLHLVATHSATNTTSYAASKSQSVTFAKAQAGAGNAGLSAVTTIATSASAATNSAIRDVGTVTVTLNAATAYATQVQATVDLTGSSISTGRVVGVLELLYTGYTTAPVIA